ncbi:MAG: tRNA dihydrouridine synthase DusB [Clostridia bacterium]|nr:tRNA dihydrouridine synthase DusB [Clostridia bacterium]
MDFGNKLILAPMAGFTDHPMRHLAVRYGADIVVSEMISAKAMHFKDKKTATLARIYEGEGIFGAQIFGHEADIMANASRSLATGEYEYKISDTLPDFIDINMGCPVKKIVSNGEGSALLRSPELCGRIIRACADASPIPVTVKIRAGWDRDSVNCVEIAKIAEANGASAIAVHARTREQMYEPYADWKYIRDVKNAVSIPVIGNGDIFSGDDGIRMLEETECDSLMIGRGAIGNPFIFDELRHRIEGKSYTPPTVSEKTEVALEHIRMLCEEKGEEIGIREARKHICHYTKGLKTGAQARQRLNFATSYEEIYDILSHLAKENQ